MSDENMEALRKQFYDIMQNSTPPDYDETLYAERQRISELESRNKELEARQIPDGWQLVPKIPTTAMIEAALMEFPMIYRVVGDIEPVLTAWKAFLSAAPKPEAQE